ncbi:hypothetical protein ACSBR2_040379 [Camellia fascicularis]
MEQRLHEAAIKGSVTLLHKVLEEDPLVLDRVTFGCFGGSPLHVAALRGHTDFVTEILLLNPDLVEVLDSSQRSPLHLASAKGHVKIVQALISIDPDMCLTCDKDGRNPLHLAVMKGKVDVLKVLIQANPHAAEVVMDRGETILHLCVMRNQFESLKELMETIRNKEIVNAKDGGGHTILHLAVANKQVEVLKYLLCNARVDVNVKNGSGFTALDILAQVRKDVENLDTIEHKLRKAGAMSGKDVGHGGVWQDTSNGHRAGEAIMAYNYPNSYPYFFRGSTIGFVASLSTIMLLPTPLLALVFSFPLGDEDDPSYLSKISRSKSKFLQDFFKICTTKEDVDSILPNYCRGMSFSSNYACSAETLDLRYEALKCECGVRAAIRVTESEKPSKGRLYVNCEKRNCQFWRWCTPKSVTMVERLRNETNLYEDQNIEIVGLKVKNQMLEQSVTVMKQIVVGLLTICIVLSVALLFK